MAAPAGEVARSLYGAWRLVRWDAGGLRFFDGTRGAALRSFWAAAIAAPMYAAVVMTGGAAPASGGGTRAVLVYAIGYVVGWTAFPLAVLYLADALGRSQHYLRFLAVYNWSIVLQYAAVLLAHLIADAVPGPIGGVLTLGVLLYTLIYEWFIARTALQLDPLPAAGVIAVDVMLALLINGIIGQLA